MDEPITIQLSPERLHLLVDLAIVGMRSAAYPDRGPECENLLEYLLSCGREPAKTDGQVPRDVEVPMAGDSEFAQRLKAKQAGERPREIENMVDELKKTVAAYGYSERGVDEILRAGAPHAPWGATMDWLSFRNIGGEYFRPAEQIAFATGMLFALNRLALSGYLLTLPILKAQRFRTTPPPSSVQAASLLIRIREEIEAARCYIPMSQTVLDATGPALQQLTAQVVSLVDSYLSNPHPFDELKAIIEGAVS